MVFSLAEMLQHHFANRSSGLDERMGFAEIGGVDGG